MRVAKWGNSLAVRLPASLVREKGLCEGENVDIDVRKQADGESFRAWSGGPVDVEREASRLRLLARLQRQRPDGATRDWSREDLYTEA